MKPLFVANISLLEDFISYKDYWVIPLFKLKFKGYIKAIYTHPSLIHGDSFTILKDN